MPVPNPSVVSRFKLTGHFCTPGKPINALSAYLFLHPLSMPQEGDPNTHCSPTKLNVNSAMRVDSDLPLIEGVPAHRAVCTMPSQLHNGMRST